MVQFTSRATSYMFGLLWHNKFDDSNKNINFASMSVHKDAKRITTQVLHEMKQNGERIAMLTAYDFSMTRLVDQAGIDIILVGDSASNVMAGHETTLPITLDQMIYHASSVVRGAKRALVVVDLPFGTYQGNSKEALNSAIRIMKESGAHAVKLEGGREVRESIERILSAGIPVMGHLGLTPQSIYKFGTYTVRAKQEEEAKLLREDAKMLNDIGCFAIVFEKIPASLAGEVTAAVACPTIGIGAGGDCDGQVLVLHDMLGITQDFSPRFLRRYSNLGDQMLDAIQNYVSDVRSRDFPSKDEQY
jgi:3-methyl-2-oxobutanoate hydroxymethyltransferase